VPAEAYLAYPGAREDSRNWVPLDNARGIDGNDLSHDASLHIYYSLPPETRADDVERWYEERLRTGGWAFEAGTEAFRMYRKDVGLLVHRYMVNTGAGPTTGTLTIAYSIGGQD
jgi:hypothetical protein